MRYPRAVWKTHPGRKRNHIPGKGGLRRMRNPRRLKDGSLYYDKADVSRWVPHQGAREIARRKVS